MSTSIGPSYDPATTAAALAENYVAARQANLSFRTQQASEGAKALASLRSAISSYQTSLLALTSSKTVYAQAATFSNPAVGSATASATATPGSYAFFVERIATAHQVSYDGLADAAGVAGDQGSLAIALAGGANFSVDLNAANTDGGALTPRELAAAINASPNNTALVSASIVTIDGLATLILTAKATGAASNITLDTSNVKDPGLQAALGSGDELVAGLDARVRLGSETGALITQASNTFTNIDGVSMTFTKAQISGEAPVTLTVAADNGATTANVQKFVDDYNKLKSAIDAMVNAGDPAEGEAAGVFAKDVGVRVLQSRLVSILREAVASGDTLAAYGIIASREGALSLDSARLTKQLAANPTGLDTLIGKATAGSPTGIAGNLDTYLKQWSSSTNGQIKQRQDANQRLQTELAVRQEQLDKQYDNAYKRYLAQFTQLQALQSQLASNTSMFESMFGDKSN